MWSEASAVVKAVVIIGAIGIVVALLLWTGVIGGAEVEASGQRGLQPRAAETAQ